MRILLALLALSATASFAQQRPSDENISGRIEALRSHVQAVSDAAAAREGLLTEMIAKLRQELAEKKAKECAKETPK